MRFRILLTSLIVFALAGFLAACGGGGSSSNVDPKQVLDKTFNNKETIKSADLDASVGVKSSGSQGGTVNFSLSGPFENQGDNKLPKLDWTVKADGSGGGSSINFEGGVINTGTEAFVSYNGTDYKVDDATYKSLQQLVEASAAQNQSQSKASAAQLKKFGISEDLLTNLKSDGTADEGGVSTNHVSGDLDIDKTVNAISKIADSGALSQVPGASSQLPSGAQLEQLKSAIKTASFDVYSGVDDNLLRRFDAHISIEVPGQGSADITLEITLDGVNESQTIEAPSGAKPLSDLLQQFGIDPSQLSQLGSLGAATGAAGATGATGGSTGSTGSAGGPSSAATQAYLDCVGKAKTPADYQKCVALLAQ